MKKVIAENVINELIRSGKNILVINRGDIITPLAKDRILHEKITVKYSDEVRPVIPETAETVKSIILGSDHNGFDIKAFLMEKLAADGYAIIDAGPYKKEKADYVDHALEVAKSVILKNADAGIMIDGTGIPSAITANKIPGIRAAVCVNEFMAQSAKEHNNANVVTLGAFVIAKEIAYSIVKKWLDSKYEGGRHQARLDKIKQIEKLFTLAGNNNK